MNVCLGSQQPLYLTGHLDAGSGRALTIQSSAPSAAPNSLTKRLDASLWGWVRFAPDLALEGASYRFLSATLASSLLVSAHNPIAVLVTSVLKLAGGLSSKGRP